MPYRWTETPTETTLDLWPHQSMTPRGFTWFIGATAALLALPLIALLGSPVVWVLLAFFLATLAALWWALSANVAARHSREALTVSPDRMHLAHLPARGPALEWEANPHWVTVHLHQDGPVEKYLTLRGNGREVELGSFLSPEEREGLFEDLTRLLR
ncbi:MAG: DUF2244 domain-containing protein [Paracoccaceae bacterium]|nr:DUF2244 domain-containing protein [Paracoccaceae bacterium]